MGAFIYLTLSVILPQRISSQILKRDIKIAQYLSREVQEQLLVNNKLALRLLLEDRLESSGDIIYIFIRARDESIITSTFQKGFPKGLVHINEKISKLQEPGADRYSLQEFLVDGKKGYDIAIPLLKGELGSLHVGVSLESSKTEIAAFSQIKYYVAMVIFIGLGVGILIFMILGVLLSNRVIKLKNFATRIGQGNLDVNIDMEANDEIGALAIAFNEMAIRLKEKIQEVSRLNIIKERDRIAFDLHDGCAQNIASIIKRLELCEKLFKRDPARAFEELRVLKENTRVALNKTRKVIFDLKLPEDANFDLSNNLKSLIMNYQEENDIKVQLRIAESLDGLSVEKSKQIFYIIEEALNNVKRHSFAHNVELNLRFNELNGLTINIKDDGRGFDFERVSESTRKRGKWGLISMRQRAVSLGGDLIIDSKPDAGTEVRVKIPIL
jgi:signal transduction histidine kinase